MQDPGAFGHGCSMHGRRVHGRRVHGCSLPAVDFELWYDLGLCLAFLLAGAMSR